MPLEQISSEPIGMCLDTKALPDTKCGFFQSARRGSSFGVSVYDFENKN